MDLSNENIIHVKKGDVEYLQFKELLKYSDRVQHAYSLSHYNLVMRMTKHQQIMKKYVKH